MAPSSTPNPERREARTKMPRRLVGPRNGVAGAMTFSAEVLGGMATVAVSCFDLGIYTVREPIVEVMRHLKTHLPWRIGGTITRCGI